MPAEIAALVGLTQLYGTVVRGSSAAEAREEKESTFSVEIFVPAFQEEDAMNPSLVRRIVDDLPAAQLRPCGGPAVAGGGGGAAASVEAAAAVLGAVCRPGSTMCSVPLVELHRKSLAHNAAGCSARLQGLGSRLELNGLTCTVLWGPNDQGQYTVELSLDEVEQSVVIVRPECLTLRVRRSALCGLLADQPAGKRKACAGPLRGEVVEPDAATSLQATDGDALGGGSASSLAATAAAAAKAAEAAANIASAQVGSGAGGAGATLASDGSPKSARQASEGPAALSAAEAEALAERNSKFEALDAQLDAELAREAAGEFATELAATRRPGPTIPAFPLPSSLPLAMPCPPSQETRRQRSTGVTAAQPRAVS